MKYFITGVGILELAYLIVPVLEMPGPVGKGLT